MGKRGGVEGEDYGYGWGREDSAVHAYLCEFCIACLIIILVHQVGLSMQSSTTDLQLNSQVATHLVSKRP